MRCSAEVDLSPGSREMSSTCSSDVEAALLLGVLSAGPAQCSMAFSE